MSFKNTLTKLGLVEDSTPIPSKKAAVSAPTLSKLNPTPTSTLTVQADPTITKMLQQSIQDAKLSGFDYLKFISATEEMKAYNTPEETRYKMSFMAAKQVGVDKDSLVKSGQHYLDVLKQDENDFNTDCTQFEKKEIEGRQVTLERLEAKLADLTHQLTQAKQEHDSVTAELEEKKAALESRKSSFQSTLQNFTNDIQTNIAKINQYLS